MDFQGLLDRDERYPIRLAWGASFRAPSRAPLFFAAKDSNTNAAIDIAPSNHYNQTVTMFSRSETSPSRLKYWCRALLLTLFVSGQGRLAFHHHLAVAEPASKPAASAPQKQTLPEAAPCRVCQLASQTRLAHLDVPSVAAAPETAQAVAAHESPAFVAVSSIRLSARAPPAC